MEADGKKWDHRREVLGPPYLLGVDVGTLSTKGVLTDLNGAILAQAFANHSVQHPLPGWMEQDAERDWWGDFVEVVRHLLQRADIPSEQIAALCISGLFPALCLADERGRPLRNAILYGDSRGVTRLEYLARVTDTELKGDEVLPKLIWLQEHEPEVFRRTKLVLGVPGYLVYRLTGQHCVDPQTAFRMGGLVNESRDGWRDEVCLELSIPCDWFPSVRSSLDIIGGVHRESAQETGLAVGTPTLVGLTDTTATLLGNGIVDRGDAMVYYGTTGWLSVCTASLEDVFAVPELVDDETPFILAAYLVGFGEALERFVSCLSEIGKDLMRRPRGLYQALDERAAGLLPGSDGLLVLPHFSGRVLPEPKPQERAAVLGLTTAHTCFHVWRALLESFGYEICRGVVSLTDRGVPVGRVVASGGGAQSSLWRQIVSDITGMPQELVVNGSAARGAALLAGLATGLIEDLTSAREGWTKVAHITKPCPEAHAKYQDLFATYLKQDLCLSRRYERFDEASGQT